METALARLRAKTDQDLSILIARQLERTLVQARRHNDQDDAIVYESSRALLAVSELPPAKRARIERMLDELRVRLERLAAAVA